MDILKTVICDSCLAEYPIYETTLMNRELECNCGEKLRDKEEVLDE